MTEDKKSYWTGDTEVVYESAKGYEWFFKQLFDCFGTLPLQNLEEKWHRTLDNKIWIELSFQYENDKHHVWIERKNDYLDLKILESINFILQGPEKFSYSIEKDGEVRVFLK